MKVFLSILAALVVVAVIAVLALIFWPLNLTKPDQLTLADDAMAWPDTGDGAGPISGNMYHRSSAQKPEVSEGSTSDIEQSTHGKA